MITFKTATIDHAFSLAELVNSAYRGDQSKLGWTTEAELLDGQRTDSNSLSEIIQQPFNQIEMAFEADRLVGCVHLKIQDADTLYFGMLTVSPALQARGLGKEIIKHVEKIAREHNLKKIKITVIQHRHELISFYERRGFQPTGRYEEFPSHDPRFGLPKVPDLKLMEYEKNL